MLMEENMVGGGGYLHVHINLNTPIAWFYDNIFFSSSPLSPFPSTNSLTRVYLPPSIPPSWPRRAIYQSVMQEDTVIGNYVPRAMEVSQVTLLFRGEVLRNEGTEQEFGKARKKKNKKKWAGGLSHGLSPDLAAVGAKGLGAVTPRGRYDPCRARAVVLRKPWQ